LHSGSRSYSNQNKCLRHDATYRHGVCCWAMSVHPFVTFMYYSVETSKHRFIFKIDSPSGSHTVLVFRSRHYGSIPTGPLNHDFQSISGFDINHCSVLERSDILTLLQIVCLPESQHFEFEGCAV